MSWKPREESLVHFYKTLSSENKLKKVKKKIKVEDKGNSQYEKSQNFGSNATQR